MMPGFYHRLQLELSNLLKKPVYAQQLGIKKFKFHKAPAKENYTAWLGGMGLTVWRTYVCYECFRIAECNELCNHICR